MNEEKFQKIQRAYGDLKCESHNPITARVLKTFEEAVRKTT